MLKGLTKEEYHKQYYLKQKENNNIKKNDIINGLTRTEYFKKYYNNNKIKYLKNEYLNDKNIFCDCCAVYCSKYDKHYKTEEHYINLSKKYNINLDLIINKKSKKKILKRFL